MRLALRGSSVPPGCAARRPPGRAPGPSPRRQREAHPRAARTPIPRSRGRCPPVWPGTPTASGSPTCASAARTAADLVAIDASSGRESLLLAGTASRTRRRGKPLPLDGYAWSPDGRASARRRPRATCSSVDAKTGAVRALTRTPEAEEFAQLSPDGRRVAFVRKNDLYVVDLAERPRDPPHQGRLRHDPERPPRLGLRRRAGQPERPGVLVGARLRRRGLPAARPGPRPHLPHRGLPARAQRGEDQRYPKAGDPNADRAGGVVGIAKDGTAGARASHVVRPGRRLRRPRPGLHPRRPRPRLPAG